MARRCRDAVSAADHFLFDLFERLALGLRHETQHERDGQRGEHAKDGERPPTLLPNMASSMRKNWETTKLPSQLAAEPKELPMPRTLNGKISPMSTHAIGPHDSAKPRI